ncbi:MAG TPA: UDP-N-acetylmuramate dehydrogenase [Alphaproteobacteria bacterium]|nr:UDP-N-acetylmuramate dehydrogenase [Alphaproteobacteria bacterium]
MSPTSSLLSSLPAARGSLEADVSLRNSTWFRVGGTAEVLFQPADEQDLAEFLKNLPVNIPVTVLGLASNTIVRDGGVAGVVIRLGSAFRAIHVDGNIVTAGAATVDAQVARTAMLHSLSGLEFLSGIPGSVGGGLRMNAGAYGTEFKDTVIDARAVDRQGNIHTLTNAQMGFSYRHSKAPEDWIFLSARFQAAPGDKETIAAKMAEIQKSRADSQPIRTYTGGSTFANPEGKKAWQLIDAAGCRGLKVGGAQVSEQHCNFLINTGNASAEDLETLGETVRQRVKESSGVELRWEIKRIGTKA